MKLYRFIFIYVLMATSMSFANTLSIFQDTPENQEYRIKVAVSSIKAAHVTIARIQELVHNDPDKAADLCSNVMKYLLNAESCLE